MKQARTAHTAKIININNKEIIFDDRIKERNPGSLNGQSISVTNREEYWFYYSNIQYGTSENIQEFFKRVYSFLDELKSKLPNYFIRSHNSYIFNAKYLLEIKRTNIILKNNYNIPISRAYKQSVKEELHDFFIDSL